MTDHSFDIVSKYDAQELSNAVHQVVKEIQTRFDFKGTKSTIELGKDEIIILGDDDFKVRSILEILETKTVKRGISLKVFKRGKIEEASGGMARMHIKLQQGIEIESAKKIVALIKAKKMKVQAAIQSDQVRVTAKKIDDLQLVMGMLKEQEFDFAIQFVNYR
jgi:cyclic-di-GMP-binding protein